MSRRPARHREARRWAAAALLGACLWSLAGPSAKGADVDFYRDVYPFLKSNCVACHNKTTTKASLNMETPEALRKGGGSGPGVVPGNADESPVYQAAAHSGDLEMPPQGNKIGAVKLSPAELASLKAWIDQGREGLGPAGPAGDLAAPAAGPPPDL
jgi:mono/diheme cytochrome c family protein